MNANINAVGEAVIPGVTSDTGTVAWQSSSSNVDGPVTALEYLHNATKSWTNVEPLNYTYNDREVQGVDLNNPVDEYGDLVGYESFISTNGVAIITYGNSAETQVTIGSESEPIRSRMPIYSRDASITEVSDKTESNSYLYDNLYTVNYKYEPYGYWTLSSAADNSYYAWDVYYDGRVSQSSADYAPEFGVRPVITVKL